MPIATLYAISLLAGIALGLYANVRALIIAVAGAVIVVLAAFLYMGQPIGWSLLEAIAVAVLVQVGYFAALLIRAASGFDKGVLDAERDGKASHNPPATGNRSGTDSADSPTATRDRASTGTDAD